MWKEILNGWVPEIISKEKYCEIRDNKNSFPKSLVGWVGFNCSYSGKWFGGFAGQVKTKIGTIRDYQDEAIRNILKQSQKLKGVKLISEPYSNLNIPNGSIIYCDPPYEGTTGYGSEFNHAFFWNWVRQKSKENSVYVSEYNAPDDFICLYECEAKSSLSANGKIGGNKFSIERLFKFRD